MGSLIMHLGISEYLKQKYNFSNEFIVGAVAPDLLKRLPDTNRKETHYLKRYNVNGRIQRLPDIDKFLCDNKNENSDYFFGYLSHLLQDRIWFRKYIPMCAENREDGYVTFVKDNSIHTGKEYTEEMYKDYANTTAFILNRIELDLEKIKAKTKNYFKNKDIDKIAEEEIRIRDIIENRENCFLYEEMILNYFNDCIEECMKYINERKL